MTSRRKIALWTAVALIAIAGSIALLMGRRHATAAISLAGVVVVSDEDPRQQIPIPDAVINASTASGFVTAHSSFSGLFRIRLPLEAKMGQSLALSFRHSGYEPLEIKQSIRDEIYVARLIPTVKHMSESFRGTLQAITNVRLRYSEKATTTTNIGSAVKVFEVINTGNVPCQNHPPCSPDGKWKATIGSVSLDAQRGNEFRNIRLSCIAGPCPFTAIESETSTHSGAALTVSARNWSDTVTFLLEAEVSQTKVSDEVRFSYPAISGRTMIFTLPPPAEGPSIEADLNGHDIVFPLGPEFMLSWAVCSVSRQPDQSQLFRCDLKPGYRF